MQEKFILMGDESIIILGRARIVPGTVKISLKSFEGLCNGKENIRDDGKGMLISTKGKNKLAGTCNYEKGSIEKLLGCIAAGTELFISYDYSICRSSKNIWYLPLEPLEKRYTCDWYWQFPEVFKNNFMVYTIVGHHYQEEELGGKFFLDPIGTNVWKMSQLTNFFNKMDQVKDGDIVFIPDGWYPGIEALAYTRDMIKKDFKIATYWHAGSYLPLDLTHQYSMERWAKGLEECWFNISDIIFVATEYHKKIIVNSRIVDPNKIYVVGFPLDVKGIRKEYYQSKKTMDIFFSGRKTEDKGWSLVENLRQRFNITVSVEEDFNRGDYYRCMAKHKVLLSPSRQDTFGIGVIEGMSLGLIPVVPDNFAFKETVPDEFRYTCEDVSVILDSILSNYKLIKEDLYGFCCRFQYQNVINKISEYLLSL